MADVTCDDAVGFEPRDPFGMVLSPGDLEWFGRDRDTDPIPDDGRCPLCGEPLAGERYFHSACAERENAESDWPPADRAELARLDAWANEMEWEHRQRYGNDFEAAYGE